MRSPRFDIRAKKLRTIFSPHNIERIWRDKVRVSMRDQFICDGVDNFDFHVNRKIECKNLSHLVLSGDYAPQRAQRILIEKSKGLCRQLVLPCVRDSIVLQCLSDALYAEIKGKAPTDRSFFEPKDHTFSSPVNGYGTYAAWLNFQKELFKFSKVRNYVVVTDIANYYDSISYVHLRNAIASITGVDECVIDMLIYVLSDLLWQPDYTPRVEVGLPQINLDAPRLLAHCFLYELDSYLASNSNLDFVRYMDDIDIGVDTIVEAKQALKAVDLVLQTKQVRLNSGKTAILSRREALQHFRVLENAQIDAVQASVDHRLKAGLPLDRQRIHIQNRIRAGLRKKSFDSGNGEKTLKRWLGLASKTGAHIKPDFLDEIIKRRPSVRENVFSFIRSKALTPSVAAVLASSSKSGLLIDDGGKVNLSNHLVETLVKTRHSHNLIMEIVASNDSQTYFGLYSKLWLLSKYGTISELLNCLNDSKHVWYPDERLGRIASSFTPLFRNRPEEGFYKDLLAESLNSGARQVYKFHSKLSSDSSVFNSMYDTLKAPNPTRGTGLTHGKFLCLLSALKNTNVPVAKIIALKANLSLALKDTYYKSTIGHMRV
jgi:hypothetical protein